MGGVASVVARGPGAIRGPVYTYYLFFLAFTFPQERSWPAGHSQLRLNTRDKQLFHLKIFLIIYMRAFSSKSILLGPLPAVH